MSKINLQNKFPYIIENPTSAPRASLGRAFVYVLMLNVKGRVKPFHVANTTHLTKRLSNHQQVTWHYKTFREPVKVWVAGTVPIEKVNVATNDLIQKLFQANYYLSDENTQITGDKSIKDLSELQLNQYFLTNQPVNVLKDWEKDWGVKTFTPIKPVTSSGVAIDNVLLRQFMASQTYQLDAARKLSMRIAENYNKDTGVSHLDLRTVFIDNQPAIDFLKYLTKLWKFTYVSSKIVPNKFILSNHVDNAIKKFDFNSFYIEEATSVVPLNVNSKVLIEYVENLKFGTEFDRRFLLMVAREFENKTSSTKYVPTAAELKLLRANKIQHLNKLFIIYGSLKNGQELTFVVRPHMKQKLFKG